MRYAVGAVELGRELDHSLVTALRGGREHGNNAGSYGGSGEGGRSRLELPGAGKLQARVLYVVASLSRRLAQDHTGKGLWRSGGACYRISVNEGSGPLSACRLPSPGPRWSWLWCWPGSLSGIPQRISNFRPHVTPSCRKMLCISSALRTLTKILPISRPSWWSSNRSAWSAASSLSTLWQPVYGQIRSILAG